MVPVTVPSFISDAFLTRGAELDGADLLLCPIDSSQTPTSDLATLDDVTAEILSAAARVAVTGVVTANGHMWDVTFEEDPITGDFDGAAEIVGYYVATTGATDADREIVAFLRTTTTPGVDAMPITFADATGAWARFRQAESSTGDDTTLTIVSAPAMFDPDAVIATWEALATAGGIPTEAIDDVSTAISVTYGVNGEAPTTQAAINNNAAWLAAVALSLAATPAQAVGPGPLIDVGLFSGVVSIIGQLAQAEGILDRWGFVAAVEDVANINLATYTAGPVVTQPTFTHGSLAGISSGQRPHTHVLLLAQTDPAENRIYEVDADTGQWSQPTDTDVFWPPGNGYRATLNAPGDDDDGMTWIWQFDDKTVVQRGGNYSDGDLTETDGRWVLWTDPTATGGGTTLTDPTDIPGATTDRILGRVTSGTGAVEELTAAQVRTLLGIDLGKIPTVVQLGSDQGVTSSTTLANTTGLSFAATSGVTYFIDGILYVTGDTAGDLKVGATHPGGTMQLDIVGIANTVSSLPGNVSAAAVVASSGGSRDDLGTITGSTVAVRIMGYYACTSTGTFQLQHAQRSSSGTATTIKAGSYFEYHT